jgi:hypothetical protein
MSTVDTALAEGFCFIALNSSLPTSVLALECSKEVVERTCMLNSPYEFAVRFPGARAFAAGSYSA